MSFRIKYIDDYTVSLPRYYNRRIAVIGIIMLSLVGHAQLIMYDTNIGQPRCGRFGLGVCTRGPVE